MSAYRHATTCGVDDLFVMLDKRTHQLSSTAGSESSADEQAPVSTAPVAPGLYKPEFLPGVFVCVCVSALCVCCMCGCVRVCAILDLPHSHVFHQHMKVTDTLYSRNLHEASTTLLVDHAEHASSLASQGTEGGELSTVPKRSQQVVFLM